MMAYRNSRTSALGFAHRKTHAALKAEVASDGKAEYRLQCDIVELLRTTGVPGLVFWHCPNGEKRTPRVGAKLKAMGTLAGVLDLTLSIPGFGIAFIEIKSPKGRVSPAQEAFIGAMEAHGHYVAVVASLAAAAEALHACGAVRRVEVAA